MWMVRILFFYLATLPIGYLLASRIIPNEELKTSRDFWIFVVLILVWPLTAVAMLQAKFDR